jgi:hypothetical protein
MVVGLQKVGGGAWISCAWSLDGLGFATPNVSLPQAVTMAGEIGSVYEESNHW